MAKRKSDLSEQLLRWSEEMGLKTKGRSPLTADDLKQICRGNMTSIWEHVVEHVRPQEKVHKIRGNIKLHNLQQRSSLKVNYKESTKLSMGREALMKKRKELRDKLAGRMRDVEHLEKDITRLKKDLGQADNDYKDSLNEIQEMNHKRTILQAYHSQCKVKHAIYSEFKDSLMEKKKHYDDLTKKSTQEMLLFSKERLDSLGNKEDILETACTKQVREFCKHIQRNFVDILESTSTDQAAWKDLKIKLWEQIEETVRKNSAEEIVNSLMVITNEDAVHLNQRTGQIDINKDVEELRFKYESGQGFVDISPGKSELKSVQQLITEKQVTHIQRFMKGEKNRTNATKLNIELNGLVAKMEDKMRERFPNHPGELDLAKTLFRAELNLVATSAAVKVLKIQQEELEYQAATSKQEKDALFARYRQIQDFQKVTDKKQSLIQVLIKENLNSRRDLDETHRKIEQYKQRDVCTHEAGTVAMTTSLKDSSSNEVKAFSDLNLEILHLTKLPSGELKPVNQLSISRLDTVSPALGGDASVRIQAALHFPSYTAPEKLLGHVVKMKCEIADIEGILHVRDLLQKALSPFHASDADVIQQSKDLCEQVRQKDSQQNDQLGPVLQARITEGAEAINVCMKTKSDLTAWWDQPAQNLTPWVKVHDLSYSQWLDKWIMAVSRMKEMMENKDS